MATINDLIKKYPVSAYYLLSFLLSWVGVAIVISLSRMPATPEETTRLFPTALIIMLVGPFVTGLMMTAFVDGKAGVRNLLVRITTWKVNIQWYVTALFFTPILVGSILWVLSQTWPEFIPNIIKSEDKVNLLLSGIGIGLAAGFFEEIGWTGFAIPKLRQKYSVGAAGLIAGGLWGLWHFPVTFWASGDSSGAFSKDLLLPPLTFYAGVLPAYRVIMVWIYDRTESVLIAMLMHASLTTCTISVFLPAENGNLLIRYYFILTVVLWVVVANLRLKPRSVGSKETQP